MHGLARKRVTSSVFLEAAKLRLSAMTRSVRTPVPMYKSWRWLRWKVTLRSGTFVATSHFACFLMFLRNTRSTGSPSIRRRHCLRTRMLQVVMCARKRCKRLANST